MLLLATLALGSHLFAPPQVLTGMMPDDKRMQWWREARFGMFIHWGLYAVPGGVWNGKNYPGASEWLLTTAQIRPEDYEPLQKQFNPVNFDAVKWARTAKAAGMKYIVITSKHHDGFALWHTKQGTWNVANTPFKRDILKELAKACKEEGIKLCFYHSIMDWHHPDYLPRRPWDKRETSQANFDRYVAYMKAQLKELLSGDYGDIGILWFDGEWEGTWTHEKGADLYKFVRSLDNDIIINNRVDKGRSGMAGMTAGDHYGDYGTPEQEIPANGLPGVAWESCMTMNNSWGFHKNDHDWKSAKTLVENLVDCASKGGNYLLNVGPNSLGEIPAPSVERLLNVGKWLSLNGESVYGTQAGPFPKPLPWGRVTQRPGKLYLHVFDNSGRALKLPGLQANVKRVYRLGEDSARGKFLDAVSPVLLKSAEGLTIGFEHRMPMPTNLKPNSPENLVPVYVLEIQGSAKVEPVPISSMADGSYRLQAEEAATTGGAGYEGGDKKAIGFWTDQKDTVSWDVTVPKTGTYNVEVEYACDAGSAGATYEISLGGGAVKGTVESTGSWSTFRTARLGTLTITKTGAQKLLVKPLTKPNFAVMNLRSVRLIPTR